MRFLGELIATHLPGRNMVFVESSSRSWDHSGNDASINYIHFHIQSNYTDFDSYLIAGRL